MKLSIIIPCYNEKWTINNILEKDDKPLSNLYPNYLEKHGYLPKSFGYGTGKANNWTRNGGWIGKWGCPDGKGECFGIGIVGNINNFKLIMQKYQSQAKKYFPRIQKYIMLKTAKIQDNY
jgi:hypothetical protein